MSQPRVILCERTGTWATAVRRYLRDDVAVSQVGSLAECREQANGLPACLLVVELTAQNLAELLGLIDEVAGGPPSARLLVLARDELIELAPLLREAGATHVFDSPRRLEGLRPIVMNHFRATQSRQTDVFQRIWDTLPWNDALTA